MTETLTTSGKREIQLGYREMIQEFEQAGYSPFHRNCVSLIQVSAQLEVLGDGVPESPFPHLAHPLG